MTNEEQKRIFARNLNKYISLNGKQQKDVAKDLGINPTTLNMWCNGNALPSTGKIRKLADYFRIGMTDLTDEKTEVSVEDEYTDITMKIALTDKRFRDIIIKYSKFPTGKKEIICDFFEKIVF
nr:MAG TPA: Repressor protein CI [Caudoviricetes sp.]